MLRSEPGLAYRYRVDHDDELNRSISGDVLAVLQSERFFETLDERLCPEDPSRPPAHCDGSYATSRAILAEAGHDAAAIEDVIDVLGSMGGCCDCEILYNVAAESRMKSRYWKAKAAGLAPHSHE
jgi:hypothetical protein